MHVAFFYEGVGLPYQLDPVACDIAGDEFQGEFPLCEEIVKDLVEDIAEDLEERAKLSPPLE